MNYDRVGPILPGRGLRQGDPLSPYLFILVTECLTALIHQSVGRGEIHGVRICRGAPEVSHLLFADDCFLFCRANVVEVNELMRILHTYEQASGQEINLVKSEVFISRNMSHAAKEDLSRILGDRLVLGTGIYLGLPSMVGRSKEIMIKSVLQAIPSYVMSMFILPTSLIDDIEKMINAFWWRSGTINNNNNNNKGIHWLSWERLTCPKAHGGLGFRNFEAFNKAMVAKQVWNIIQNPNSLVAKLIKARYFPRSSLFEAPLGYNPSFAWRGMWHARQILSLGCRWRIGSGENIRVMHDPWLRGKVNKWVPSPQPTGLYQLSVRDLLHENVNSVREDKVVWKEERNGCYSVKSGYKLGMRYIIGSDKYHVAGNWNDIWKAQAPHKARHLLWRLCRGCLSTRYRLLERRVECNLNCPVCYEEIEDEIHIFFLCAVARDSWCAAGLSSVLHNDAYQQSNAMDRIFAMCSNESSDIVGRVAMLLWCIWQNRNDKLWNDNVQTPRQIERYAFDAWSDWYSVHKLRSNSESRTTEAGLVRWEKPALGWVKCNVDVAFVSGSGRTSVGLCFRNNKGQVMAGLTQWQQTVMSSVEGEAWTLLLAMEEARHRGLDRVQFESDSKVLVEAIHMKRRGNSEFLSIVHDIISFMSSFLNFEVKFVRRQANSVAHTLARAANSWSSFHRFENIPLCIEHLVVNEMQGGARGRPAGPRPTPKNWKLLGYPYSRPRGLAACEYPNVAATWKNGTDCCSWNGVTCDTISGHVVGLNLGCEGIQGLPYMDIWCENYERPCTDSVTVTTKGNVLTLGRIPKFFVSIDFSRNKFEGEIPNAIGEHHSPTSTNNIWSEGKFGFGWKAVAIGYGCGFVIGIGLGYLVFLIGKPRWLVMIFGGQPKRRVNRRRARVRRTNGSTQMVPMS
ncbi:hypothetical protein TSUD_256080 [Trifolium subterraneum]|uniref:Reverse transcriptase domain-containing protein n=1 Tax=Trifolium subterraneum TaxID=3900 RepID=A0A2Z6MX46_TRISU|nr:hypothetical protein TSUD_256080 [Trifolium subterraneum]